MQRQQYLKSQNKVKVIKWIWITVMIAVIVAVWNVLFQANKPILQTRTQAIEMAQKYVGINKVTGFYSANLNQTYYTVAGVNKHSKPVYAVIAKKGGPIKVFNQNAGISEEQAVAVITKKVSQADVKTVSLTMLKGQLFWLVSYNDAHNQLNYAYVDFKDGVITKQIQNI